MGEAQDQPFQFSFNSSLKVDLQGSVVTSDGGLVQLRELDEQSGFGKLIERRSADTCGKNAQLPLADLLRQSIYVRLAVYELDIFDRRIKFLVAEFVHRAPEFRA